MDAKKRLEVLNNVMSLLVRCEIRGAEAKPASEAIDFIKEQYDAAVKAVGDLQAQEQQEKQDGQQQS